MLDAVGPRDDQRHRHAALRGAGIAHERRQMHCLAGAIDAAVGIGEAVDRARRSAAFDAAVGQIEGRRASCRGTRSRQPPFRPTASPARARLRPCAVWHRSARSRARPSSRCRASRCSWRPGARLCRRRAARHWSASARTHARRRRRHSVVRPRSETMNHWLRELAAVASAVDFGSTSRGQQIDARLQFRQRFGDRERGRHLLVELGRHDRVRPRRPSGPCARLMRLDVVRIHA